MLCPRGPHCWYTECRSLSRRRGGDTLLLPCPSRDSRRGQTRLPPQDPSLGDLRVGRVKLKCPVLSPGHLLAGGAGVTLRRQRPPSTS